MKNLIFSIYVPITERSIRTNTYFEDGGVSKSQTTKTQFEKYKHKLIDVKRQYAEQCGADFVLIEHVDQQFFNDEFDSINFYKHHLIEKFCNDYDNILYMDFDVIPNTAQSFFDTHSMDVVNVHAVDATKQNTWPYNAKQSKKDYKQILDVHFDRYHMYCKAKCKLAMLSVGDVMSQDHHVANTGIIGGSSQALSKVQITKRLPHCVDALQQAVQENMFGSSITQYYFANNETFYSYILDKHNIKWHNMTPEWHTMIMDQSSYDIKHQIHNAKLVHMINKKFDMMWSTDV